MDRRGRRCEERSAFWSADRFIERTGLASAFGPGCQRIPAIVEHGVGAATGFRKPNSSTFGSPGSVSVRSSMGPEVPSPESLPEELNRPLGNVLCRRQSAAGSGDSDLVGRAAG